MQLVGSATEAVYSTDEANASSSSAAGDAERLESQSDAANVHLVGLPMTASQSSSAQPLYGTLLLASQSVDRSNC